jgi:hypothetical protein
MAEIPIRKRTSLAAWAACVIAACTAVGLLIYALAPKYTEWRERSRAGDAITDVTVLVTLPDAAPVIGRKVTLQNVSVASVTGDRTFWIATGHRDPVFVVLDEQRTPGTATEGRYDVNVGQTIDIHGTIERFPGWEEARARWKVDAALPFQEQKIYIAADRLNITERP